jgi:hypothetical protein
MLFSRRRAVLFVLCLSLLFRLLFVARDMRSLVMQGPLYDDSFYSFAIARNIAAGFGSTFDHSQPTNGYQPLYVFLLVPVYWLCGQSDTAPIYAALVLSSILNVLTGAILYRLLRRDASPWAALFGLVLWGFGPAIVRQAVNGLETSLAMFLLAAALEYYLTVYRGRPQPTGRQSATLGLLLGLAVFARIDAALFGVALLADALWRGRDGRRVRGILQTGLVAGAVVLPWCIGSELLVGEVLPESGKATRFLSEAYAPHDHPALAQASFDDGPPGAFFVQNLSRSMLLLGTSPALHIFTRGLEWTLLRVHVEPGRILYVIGSMLALVGLMAVFVAYRHRLLRTHGDFNFLYLYSVLLVAAYSFVVFGHIFFSRYYYPIFFFSIVLGAFAFDILLGLVHDRRWRRRLAATVVALYALVLPYMSWNRLSNGDYRFLQVVDWIDTHTPPGATIGVFNCGAIGYFSDRRVINLDGKVNRAALEALRNGDIRRYIADQGIDYVIDHEWILGRFLFGGARQDGLQFARVSGDGALGVPGWGAYHVLRGVTEARTGTPSSFLSLRP